MVTKLKIAAVSRKKYMLIQNTYDLRCCEKVIILNVLYILKGGDTLKGLLLHVCLTIAYLSCGRHKWRLISPPPFQYGKSLLKYEKLNSLSKVKHFFLHKEYLNNDLSCVMKPNTRSKIADKFNIL